VTRIEAARAGRWSFFVAALMLFCLGLPGSAHVIVGSKSLPLRIAEADLVVRGRVVDPEALFVGDAGRTRRHLVELEVLEVLKGTAASERLRIAQDGHDVPRYRVGDEALFFLTPIGKSRELRALAVPGGPAFVSSQEHEDRFLIEAPHGATLLSAVRTLAASENVPMGPERIALIRIATLDLLTSGDARLGAAALASLVLSPDAAFIVSDDLPRLEAFLADGRVSIGLRAGVLAELERRRLLEGPAHWRALLDQASPEDLATAIRAAGTHPSEPVRAFLLARLTSQDEPPEIAAEAAIALGAWRDPSLVSILERVLERARAQGDRRLEGAVRRGLRRMGRNPGTAELGTDGRGAEVPADRGATPDVSEIVAGEAIGDETR